LDTNATTALPDLNQHYTGHLRVRVCGICRQDRQILVVRHANTLENYSLWSPPGGGLQFGEKIKDCLVREFREETGLEVTPTRFLFLQEFLQEPLHAIEFFFEVQIVGGTLKTGSDPELGPDKQLIQEVAFKTLLQLQQDRASELHQIFKNLIDLDDLYVPQHRFLT
jgi:8-oxo-dGTP diphosphatase